MTQQPSQPAVPAAQQETVRVERAVKINRLLLLGAGSGALLAALLTTLFPVVPEGFYTLGQITGFMALVGAALGLLAGALLALFLTWISRRRRGTATAVRQRGQEPSSL